MNSNMIILVVYAAVAILWWYISQNRIKRFGNNVISILSNNLKSKDIAKETDATCVTWGNADFFAIQEANFPISLVGIPDPTKVVNLEAGKPYTDPTRQFFNKWYALCFAYKDAPSSTYALGVGVGVATNSGFHVDESRILQIGGGEKKGILVLHGHFNKRKDKFTFANMHGDWNGSYENALNTNALLNFMTYMKLYRYENPSSRFVLIGDMNLKAKQISDIIPDLQREYFHSKIAAPSIETKVATLHNSNVAIDHMITDLEVVNLRVLQPSCGGTDHFPIRAEVRLPYDVYQESIF